MSMYRTQETTEAHNRYYQAVNECREWGVYVKPFKELYNMTPEEFVNEVGKYPLEILDNMKLASQYEEFVTEFKDQFKTVATPWKAKMDHVSKRSNYYRTTSEGKKAYATLCERRHIRTSEQETEDAIVIGSISVVCNAFKSERKNKKQTQLNIERMKWITELQNDINRGGVMRSKYEDKRMERRQLVKNMPSDKETANIIMKDKRKKTIPALIISWILMPLYAIIRAIDFGTDNIVANNIAKIMPTGTRKLSGTTFLGKISTRLILSVLISGIEACGRFEGVNTASLTSQEIYAEITFYTLFMTIPIFIIISLVTILLGVIPSFLSNFYGDHIVSSISFFFIPKTENEIQIDGIEVADNEIKYMEDAIEFRRHLIQNAMSAITQNTPYCDIDDVRKRWMKRVPKIEKEYYKSKKA